MECPITASATEDGEQKYSMSLFLDMGACINISSLKTMQNMNIQVDYNDIPSDIVAMQVGPINFKGRATFFIHIKVITGPL